MFSANKHDKPTHRTGWFLEMAIGQCVHILIDHLRLNIILLFFFFFLVKYFWDL